MSTKQILPENARRVLGMVVVVVVGLAAAVVLSSTMSYAVEPDATVSMDPAAGSVFRGEAIDVMVKVDGAGAIKGYDFRLSWDPSVVEVLAATPAGGFAGTEFSTEQIETGELLVGAALETGSTEDGELAVITMMAPVGSAAGETMLDLFEVNIVGADLMPVDVMVEDGTLTSIAVDVAPAYPAEWKGVGDTFTELVRVHGADGTRGFEFEVSWDGSVIDVLDVAPAGEFAGTSLFTKTEGADSWSVIGALDTVASGTGALLELSVEALAPGVSPLTLSTVRITEKDFGTQELAEDALGQGELNIAESTVYVDPAESLVMEQDTFSVQIMKSTDEALSAFEFFLRFDPKKVEFVSVAPGADATGLVTGSLQAPNVVGVVGAQAGTLVPGGTAAMAEITFMAKEEGTSMLDVLDAVEAQETPYDPVSLVDTNIDRLPDPEVVDGIVDATKRAVAFEFAEIGELQVVDVPFGITIRAITEDGETAHYFGTADLTDLTETIDPTTATFVNGVAMLDVTISEAMMDDVITASATDPVTLDLIEGESNPFDVCEPVEIVDLVSDSPVMLTEPMHFTATVTGSPPITYMWDFGDEGAGELLAGGQETGTYLFAAPGTYTVTLTVENPCGTDTAMEMVEVEPFKLYLPIVMSNFTP